MSGPASAVCSRGNESTGVLASALIDSAAATGSTGGSIRILERPKQCQRQVDARVAVNVVIAHFGQELTLTPNGRNSAVVIGGT